MVGLMSQIGWKENPDGEIPIKVVPMEKIFILFDTDGGNFLVIWGILHSKIQHRETVMEKVMSYLNE